MKTPYTDISLANELNNLIKRIKKLKVKGYAIIEIIHISKSGTTFDNIKNLFRYFASEEIEYPENKEYRIEFRNYAQNENYLQIEWNGYNWLVRIIKKENDYIIKEYLQVYEELKNLIIPVKN